MCDNKNERLGDLYRREMARLDTAIAKRDQNGMMRHLKRCSRLIKAMDFSFMKGSAA